jgi:TPR repeat protein
METKNPAAGQNPRAARVKGLTAQEIYRIGKTLYRSVSVQSDLEDAIFYFKTAADMGYPPAQNMYAFCLDQCLNTETAVYGYFNSMNLGPPPFLKQEMIRYYRLACDAGHKRALNNLGICYVQGNGVPIDIEMGMNFLYQSKQAGDRLGARNYDTLTANHNIPNRKATFAYGRR